MTHAPGAWAAGLTMQALEAMTAEARRRIREQVARMICGALVERSKARRLDGE
jgi:hypothetical protein